MEDSPDLPLGSKALQFESLKNFDNFTLGFRGCVQSRHLNIKTSAGARVAGVDGFAVCVVVVVVVVCLRGHGRLGVDVWRRLSGGVVARIKGADACSRRCASAKMSSGAWT